jgi:hypothetical protein
MCQSNENGIQDLIEVFARVLGKESEDEISVSLQLGIFSPITAVGFFIGQVLRSVQFNYQAIIRAEEVDFHTPVVIKWDRQSHSGRSDLLSSAAFAADDRGMPRWRFVFPLCLGSFRRGKAIRFPKPPRGNVS